MVSEPGALADLGAGKELWAAGGVSCRLLTHHTAPRFEVRLLSAGGLIARQRFDNEVAAVMFAREHMRAYGAV